MYAHKIPLFEVIHISIQQGLGKQKLVSLPNEFTDPLGTITIYSTVTAWSFRPYLPSSTSVSLYFAMDSVKHTVWISWMQPWQWKVFESSATGSGNVRSPPRLASELLCTFTTAYGACLLTWQTICLSSGILFYHGQHLWALLATDIHVSMCDWCIFGISVNIWVGRGAHVQAFILRFNTVCLSGTSNQCSTHNLELMIYCPSVKSSHFSSNLGACI